MTVPKAAQSDNKLAERAGWDMALLKLEFEEILKLDSEFDLTVIGIELGELDVILDAGSDPKGGPSRRVPGGPRLAERAVVTA